MLQRPTEEIHFTHHILKRIKMASTPPTHYFASSGGNKVLRLQSPANTWSTCPHASTPEHTSVFKEHKCSAYNTQCTTTK